MAHRVELAKGAETQLEDLYLWVIERAKPGRGLVFRDGTAIDRHAMCACPFCK